MSRKRNMDSYLNVIHRIRLGQSIREIYRETKLHRTIIRRLKTLASEKGWLDPSLPEPELASISGHFESIGQLRPKDHPLDPFKAEIGQWLNLGYTITVIHHLITQQQSCSKSTVERYVRKHFPIPSSPVMRRSLLPGDILDVDFGQLGIILEEETGNRRRAYIISMRLRYSRRAYRAITLDQTVATFLLHHLLAFEYFGGVPHKVVLDNLKAGVIQASRTDPILNRSYEELARHYGFLISPCHPYTPEHKGGVESDIKYVKRNFWPIALECEKVRGHDIPRLSALRQSLELWVKEVADVRVISGVGKTPQELFNQGECQALKGLPQTRWDPVDWKQAVVGSDWRVRYDNNYYSVPFHLINETVMIRAGSSQIAVYHNLQEVTQHIRLKGRGEFSRRPEHAPPLLEEVMQATRESLLIRGEKKGGYIQQAVERLLHGAVKDGLNAARCLLKLEERVGQVRLEAACKRALYFDEITYGGVKTILEKHLESELLEESNPTSNSQLNFKYARDASQYYMKTIKELT